MALQASQDCSLCLTRLKTGVASVVCAHTVDLETEGCAEQARIMGAFLQPEQKYQRWTSSFFLCTQKKSIQYACWYPTAVFHHHRRSDVNECHTATLYIPNQPPVMAKHNAFRAARGINRRSSSKGQRQRQHRLGETTRKQAPGGTR